MPGKGPADYYLRELEALVGGKITGRVRTGVDPETGDEFYGLVITVGGQKFDLIFLSDDEGNEPGSFRISRSAGPMPGHRPYGMNAPRRSGIVYPTRDEEIDVR